MRLTKKKGVVITCFLGVLMLTLSIIAMNFGTSNNAAASTFAPENLVYTLITNDSGEQEYKVALDATDRPIVERIIIPDTWQGKPVTEIADSGFMACPQGYFIFRGKFILYHQTKQL